MSVADHQTISVLLVCMGNICRSPLAHGALRRKVRELGLQQRIMVDSAGTHDYHVGAPPDERAQATANRRGMDISDLRARAVVEEDFRRFDLILAMDEENLKALRKAAGSTYRDKVHLFMEYALGEQGRSVPDPYYGGPIGFERVLDMVEEAMEGLAIRLQENPGED